MDDIVEQVRALLMTGQPGHWLSNGDLYTFLSDHDRQREEIGRKDEAIKLAIEYMEAIDGYIYASAVRHNSMIDFLRTALSDTTREEDSLRSPVGKGDVASPKTAQHRGCSVTEEDGND